MEIFKQKEVGRKRGVGSGTYPGPLQTNYTVDYSVIKRIANAQPFERATLFKVEKKKHR
jgi:hypothetical protein